MLGLKSQVSSMCTGGNTDLLHQLTLETRQEKAPFRVSGIPRWQESSSSAGQGMPQARQLTKGCCLSWWEQL